MSISKHILVNVNTHNDGAFQFKAFIYLYKWRDSFFVVIESPVLGWPPLCKSWEQHWNATGRNLPPLLDKEFWAPIYTLYTLKDRNVHSPLHFVLIIELQFYKNRLSMKNWIFLRKEKNVVRLWKYFSGKMYDGHTTKRRKKSLFDFLSHKMASTPTYVILHVNKGKLILGFLL